MNRDLSDTKTGVYLKNLYGEDEKIIDYQQKRYKKLSKNFREYFREAQVRYFSSPGRTEISGNHTDHNNGVVIAASINLDSIACAAKSNSDVEIYSDGFNRPFKVSLDNLNPVDDEAGTTYALIRGIAAGLSEKGYKIGGLKACITSDVLIGSGLSSSASIEVLIGTIFNHLYNDGKISAEEIAKIGQFAENKFFKKPCGLMDQVACATGGIISIDFKDKNKPVVKKIDFDFNRKGYSLLVVHTGGSHINLTDDYAAIPEEMKSVASVFGKEVCREIDFSYFMKSINRIRSKVSDRAILRVYHFLKENERVKNQIEALKKNDFAKFLHQVNDSGNSSFKWLQNIYSTNDVNYQPVSLALAMTENFIDELGQGACRIHGGGFEGTIQVFLPESSVAEFKKYMEGIFSDFSILNLQIRQTGAVEVIEI
ncbi:MAG: galactokinase [Ignavibacteria bacterium GWA2_35_9]|nr:MAG: galactokinase [Ignavibacteria bacterium GWA2_35_9]OGU49167.1 MAG: galactokinase [Ignavibacteria bacterium GWC2_36_12]